MLHRQAYIENRRVLADSGEINVDVSIRDPITSMWFELRAQNGGTSNKASPLAACVDSIELIDGSEVLVSLNGFEALAITAYQLGHIPYQLICEEGGLYQNWFVCLPFGRFFGDPSYGFDPGRFQNPQIRFKWNLANVNAVGATGFLTGTGRFTAMADIMEGGASPGGMITRRQHYAFVPAASGALYIDLPTDRPHRAMYIRCHEDGVGAFGNISHVKVSADQDKFIPLDMRRTDFLRWLTLRYPPFHYKHNLLAANGDTVYLVTKLDEVAVYYPYLADTVVNGVVQGSGEQVVAVYTAGSGNSSDISMMALVHGWLPFGVSHIEWGDREDPNSWLNSSMFRSLRLELTQDNAGGNASVVLEQERIY